MNVEKLIAELSRDGSTSPAEHKAVATTARLLERLAEATDLGSDTRQTLRNAAHVLKDVAAATAPDGSTIEEMIQRARSARKVLVPVVKRDGTTTLITATATEIEHAIAVTRDIGVPPWEIDEIESNRHVLVLDIPDETRERLIAAAQSGPSRGEAALEYHRRRAAEREEPSS